MASVVERKCSVAGKPNESGQQLLTAHTGTPWPYTIARIILRRPTNQSSDSSPESQQQQHQQTITIYKQTHMWAPF